MGLDNGILVRKMNKDLDEIIKNHFADFNHNEFLWWEEKSSKYLFELCYWRKC